MKTTKTLLKDTDSHSVQIYPGLMDLTDQQKNQLLSDILWCVHDGSLKRVMNDGILTSIETWNSYLPFKKIKEHED